MPYGGVAYPYRMGVYEISEDQVKKAAAGGLANVRAEGRWTNLQPATYITWYEAAAFANWLNESKGYHKAYDLLYTDRWEMVLWSDDQAWSAGGINRYRHKDAFYFLPTEDEWYKAAFHKNDGVTVNYWDYASAKNAAPDGVDSALDTGFDAVFGEGYSLSRPYDVTNVGAPSPYGTYGQNGNVEEWCESSYNGQTASASANRVVRGGGFQDGAPGARPITRFTYAMTSGPGGRGFRVASSSGLSQPRLQLRPNGATGFIFEWDAQPGIVYNLLWAADLSGTFETISGDIEHPEHSYTNTMQLNSPSGFYRVSARPK
ncbi:MAG TPA: SUMF1/EgtB/PvdO family nonheme iron enzyme [Candidatus Sulfotelmatobacter sp.]|nr:SUMF1/EgtB/PvdO family nonheme iron enzyme [Candidatus Sulfotelmatobacter sp.]